MICLFFFIVYLFSLLSVLAVQSTGSENIPKNDVLIHRHQLGELSRWSCCRSHPLRLRETSQQTTTTLLSSFFFLNIYLDVYTLQRKMATADAFSV